MSPFEKLLNFSTAHRLSAHVIFWTFTFIMFFSKNTSSDPEELRVDILFTVYYEIFSIIAAYFLSYRILPRLMVPQKHIWVWIEFISVCYLTSITARIAMIYGLEPFVRKQPFVQEPISEILTDLPTLFWAYFLHIYSLSLFFVFIKLIKDQYLIQKKSLLLEKQKAETELKILKAQLNPHFLFNTLNNIYSLSIINSPITSQSIAVLSEILDCILYRCSSTYVPVSQEITLLENYISLEKLRYDDRLSVTFNHEMDQNGSIAPLILLSLVENAFKHGAGEDIGTAPKIDIDLKLLNNNFEFIIRNTINKTILETEGGKIGLNNIIQQLDKIYPENYTFNITKTDEDFTAYLKINLSPESNLA
ncbi:MULTISPECIES: sensor histidine kinase [unclassified Flavobacterium]|uniref:sensor histidine kinase n=1 Tax=unclassified Flavobacterium TaxID=196869 RepID=UPI0012A8EDA1|nr:MULTISPECIES: sensor histidine kinase [unclassified Flavobacterium]MBF4487663.1 sensor histidine kinase [Flavobacterium sp. CSZ]QGK73812.1 histidine kinase [Flavobacterium sp. SLB02]